MLLAVAALGAFANIMRYAQQRQADMVWAGALCYLTAAAACGGAWAWRSEALPGGPAALYGVASGLTILVGYFVFSACIRVAGVGVAQVFERLSMVVAAALSILLWGNVPGVLVAVGLALAVVSVPLMSQEAGGIQSRGSRGKMPLLLLLLLVTGLGCAVLEAFRRSSPEGVGVSFLLCQYVAIGIGSLAAALWRRARLRRREFVFGIVLGVVNIVFYYASLRSLSPGRPGTVVFPTIAAGTILVSAGAGALLWGERYRLRTVVGMVVAIAALILINIRSAGA